MLRTRSNSELLRSSAMVEILSFLKPLEKQALQGVSNYFYHIILPRGCYECHLSAHTKDRLFSYSVNEGSILYIYEVPERTWVPIEPRNGHLGNRLKYSMQVVVTPRNKVFLLGGAEDIEANILSKVVLEWDVRTNRVERAQDMPMTLMDFGACYHRGKVYAAGGVKSL